MNDLFLDFLSAFFFLLLFYSKVFEGCILSGKYEKCILLLLLGFSIIKNWVNNPLFWSIKGTFEKSQALMFLIKLFQSHILWRIPWIWRPALRPRRPLPDSLSAFRHRRKWHRQLWRISANCARDFPSSEYSVSAWLWFCQTLFRQGKNSCNHLCRILAVFTWLPRWIRPSCFQSKRR